MINQIIIGIAQALNGAFGDDYEIHCQEIEQDLKEPCFLILLLNASNEQLVGDRYSRKQPFDILYFPKSKSDSRSEMYEVMNKLNDALEYINFGEGLLRGINMKGQIIDDVLHFFVDYNFTVIKQREKIYMQELTIKGRVKQYGNN